MAQAGDEISPADSESHQSPPENATQQPPSAPPATVLERRSSNTVNSLRSVEEGVSVESKLLGVHVYSIMKAHIVLPRSQEENLCRSSQSRTRALRLHILFEEPHDAIPST